MMLSALASSGAVGQLPSVSSHQPYVNKNIRQPAPFAASAPEQDLPPLVPVISNPSVPSSSTTITSNSAPIISMTHPKTIGDMIDRVEFATKDEVLLSLAKTERQVYRGFSNTTLRRYQAWIAAAENLGFSLHDYASMPFPSLSQLCSPSLTHADREKFRLQGVLPTPAAASTSVVAVATATADTMVTMDDDSDVESYDSGDEVVNKETGEKSVRQMRQMPPLPPGVEECGHLPIENAQDPLPLPEPTKIDESTLGSIYCAKATPPNAPNERRKLLKFMHTSNIFGDTSLMPFRGQGDTFGNLHASRINTAVRRIQDEFHTGPIWTRKFLSVTHANHQRLASSKYIEESSSITLI